MAALIAAAVVYVARPDTASGGALPPLKIVSPSSIPSSPHMTLTALYSRYGKKRCAFGAAAVLTADAKIMADEMRPGMVTFAPVTEDLPRLLKVIVLDSRTLQTPQQSRLTPLHPRVPSRGPPPHLQGNSSGFTHTTRRRSPDSPPYTLECPWSWSSLDGSHHAMALRSRVTPTRTLGTQVRSRYNLLLPRAGPKTVPRTTVYGAPHHGNSPPVNTNSQLTYTGPTLRPCHLPHASDPAVSARTDPLTGTIIQRCGETRTRGTDIRVLCPPHARPPHGHAAPGMGSSGFSAGLVSLPVIHELPPHDSNDDANSDAHPPCPLQIGVCPQSRQTTDFGTPISQLTAVGHIQDCAATRTAAVIPHHFLDAENAFLNREEDPAHSLWASCSEPPAPRHNATADLSASYGTSATLGQHKTCPDRDDSERARSVTTPPFLSRMTSAPLFVPFEHAYVTYDASLHCGSRRI